MSVLPFFRNMTRLHGFLYAVRCSLVSRDERIACQLQAYGRLLLYLRNFQATQTVFWTYLNPSVPCFNPVARAKHKLLPHYSHVM